MTASTYKLRFWGTRGTVPTPASDRMRYGGNTSCLAVALNDREHIIFDCGTGARLLGAMLEQGARDHARQFDIFFSHYHFDHVEGLPLFLPLYDPDSTIRFHGIASGGRQVGEILEAFISPPYFPVKLANAPAKLEYVPDNGKPTVIRDVTVSSLPLNHPDGSRSYRLEHGDRRIVDATDHEHGNDETDQALVHFSKEADYLIYDAMYQQTEYDELRRGWGHSTWYAAVQTARAARVKTLVLFHHHPDHSDEELEKVLAIARQEFPATEIAREGMELLF